MRGVNQLYLIGIIRKLCDELNSYPVKSFLEQIFES